jgi:uncharacterized protein (TIGR03067 family)
MIMRLFSIALMLLVISQSSAQQPAENKQVPDQDLQGVWIVTGLETGGKAESGPYRGSFLFLKDKAILREGYPQIEYALVLDGSKRPNKYIDLTIKNKTVLGIYRIENDVLTLCVSMGGVRPTDFSTKAGSDCERFTMRPKYTDKKMTFAVDIPGKPEEKQLKITTTSGEITCSSAVSRNDAERLSYLVSVMPITSKLDKPALDEAMNALKKAMLTEVRITPKSMDDPGTEFKSVTLTGLEWNIGADTKGSKDKATAKIRVFAAGENRENLFGLMVVGTLDDGARSRNLVNRFWESFELLPVRP